MRLSLAGVLSGALVVISLVLGAAPPVAAQTAATAPEPAMNGGPVRLRQPPPAVQPGPGIGQPATGVYPLPRAPEPEYVPGEFERYVQRLVEQSAGANAARPAEPATTRPPAQGQTAGTEAPAPRPAEAQRIRRFGADLMTRTDDADAVAHSPMVPPDYLVSPGDEVVVTLWGSVDADVRAFVDRSGRITIPRVGPVFVAGSRYEDLPSVVSRRVAQVFRNFELSVSLGQLRAVRVYVTGYVARPGAYTVTSLSTLTAALTRAGGPSAAGSFRNIQLRRGNAVVSTFDFYRFLLDGDRRADLPLQADDVIQVGPVGAQVALIGSVNQPAVFEIRPGETVADLLRMAGGFSAVADRTRLAVEGLGDRASVRIRELTLPADAAAALAHGDVLRAFSAVEVALPVQRQNKRVRIEGEVVRPGEYVLPPNTSLRDALEAAGGLTPAAYVYGAEFSRESVRITQQENYERALRDLETELTRAATTQRTSTAEEAAVSNARSAATTRLVERLRAVKPSGRVVLQLQPENAELPDLALEDGDRLYIPPRATTIGVFGSVFNGGSYLYGEGRMVDDYLRLAGGPTRGADARSIFVIRANGSVISGRQRSSWWGGGELAGVAALPGDTIFVPEEINKSTFLQDAKDWSQVLYQLGIGLAAYKAFNP